MLVSFISRKEKKKEPLWLQFDQLNSWKDPPPPPPHPHLFIPLPVRNIKLSVFPSNMRKEISSLSIKLSRYFIRVPVGPEALTLFNVAPLYFCSPPLSLSTLSLPEASYSRGGVYAAGFPPLWNWWGLSPKWGYRFQSEAWAIELSDAVDFKQWSAGLLGFDRKMLQEEPLAFD